MNDPLAQLSAAQLESPLGKAFARIVGDADFAAAVAADAVSALGDANLDDADLAALAHDGALLAAAGEVEGFLLPAVREPDKSSPLLLQVLTTNENVGTFMTFARFSITP